jgi:hypothetical protein
MDHRMADQDLNSNPIDALTALLKSIREFDACRYSARRNLTADKLDILRNGVTRGTWRQSTSQTLHWYPVGRMPDVEDKSVIEAGRITMLLVLNSLKMRQRIKRLKSI